MRRTLYLLVVLGAAAALLVPSLASPFSGSDRIHEDIVIEPADGPNGKYAVVNADGSGGQELALDFGPSNPEVEGNGVAANTVTPFDRVFTVTYTGEQQARVWVSSDLAGVTFYRGADPTATLGTRANAVALAPDETLTVGVLIDTTERTSFSADEFTVHARVGTPTENGDAIPSGGDGGLAGDIQPPTTVAPTTTGTDGTTAETTRSGASFAVTEATLSSDTVTPGDQLLVNATVENAGGRNGTVTLPLFVDGERVDRKTVFVPAGESRTVTYTTSFERNGTATVRVGPVEAGTVVVTRASRTSPATPAEAAPDVPPTTASTPANTSPGGGVGGAVVWVSVLVVLAGSGCVLGARRYLS